MSNHLNTPPIAPLDTQPEPVPTHQQKPTQSATKHKFTFNLPSVTKRLPQAVIDQRDLKN